MSIYVRFPGIDGECQSKGLEKFSEVESFEISAEKSVEGVSGQSRRRGDVKLGDVTITKILDSTAPSLFLQTARSSVMPVVFVEFTESFTDQEYKQTTAGKGSPAKHIFMEIVLEDVISSSYSISASGEDSLTETIVLNYTRIFYRYRLKKKTGEIGTSVAEKADSSVSLAGGMACGGWDAEISREISATHRHMQ